MRALLKKLLSPFLQKAGSIYFSKPRRYSYKNISVIVEPGVFPPFLTISTKLLLDFTDRQDLHGKTFLELGCGCGIISILAAKKGADVTAVDINTVALDALKIGAASNNVSIEILYSDLFENLQNKSFDIVVINPPYYPKNPKSIAEKAWFCGDDFEYFRNLFSQLESRIADIGNIFMILSEDCQIETIKGIASKHSVQLTKISTKTVAGEKNYIFLLKN